MFAGLEGIAVVQVHCDGDIRVFLNRHIDNGIQIADTCISTCTSGYLQDKRGLFFGYSSYDALCDFHIVHIERAYCIAAF